jgi:putative transposase
MLGLVRIVAGLARAFLNSRSSLAAENIALRQQLLVLKRRSKRPVFRKRDRLFWICLSQLWKGWRSTLLIIQPETVIRWLRQGFRWYWRRKSRSKPGRPRIDEELRQLIRRMSQDNPIWGAPRILSELQLLGYVAAESTVAKYMARPRKPPSPTWRSFLKNHASQIAAIDFFTVPTITFRILYGFIVLSHDRRKIIHFNVTTNPTAQWTAHQIRQAFPEESAPRFLIRDNDGIYGHTFRRQLRVMGIEDVRTAYRSPWQNAYAERVIGSIRRECLDHMIIFSERHLRKVLTEYVEYYNTVRPHLSLARNAPIPRNVDPPERGKVVATPILGGLHHHYHRVA